MKAARAFLERLARLGVEDCFLVPGGAIMHLVDEIQWIPEHPIRPWAFHDERTAAMAAEGYARVKGKPALLLVSSGPGVLNALNGVWGAYVDSVPMIVVSGQVRSDTTCEHHGLDGQSIEDGYSDADTLRQLGDQELQTRQVVLSCVKAFCSYSSHDSRYGPNPIWHADWAWSACRERRPGPAWIDWSVDLQGQEGDWTEQLVTPLNNFQAVKPLQPGGKAVSKALAMLAKAQRPVVIVGNGVPYHCPELRAFLDVAQIPVVSAFRHDQIDHEHPCWIGRQGTLGDRAGNLAAQRADLLLVIGCRMSIRQVTYDWQKFSPDSKRIMVDIDHAELDKPTFRVDLSVLADSVEFLKEVTACWSCDPTHELALARRRWLSQCQQWRDKYPATLRATTYEAATTSAEPSSRSLRTGMVGRRHTDAGLDPYLFLSELFAKLPDDVTIVTSDATAYIVSAQVSTGRHRQFSNSGCASMGYGIAAAIGAAIAGSKVLCVEGDGSIMQNLSALATLAEFGLPVNVVVLCNGGYASIKSTHQRMFGRKPLEPRHLCQGDLAQVFAKFWLPTDCYGNSLAHVEVDVENSISDCTDFSKPGVNVIELDPSIPIEPRLEARVVDGKIVTATLDKMSPEVEE